LITFSKHNVIFTYIECFDLVKTQHVDLSTKYTIYDIFIDNFL